MEISIRKYCALHEVTFVDGNTKVETGFLNEIEAKDLATNLRESADQLHPLEPLELHEYDAGLLASHGGGDVDWWQDYVRAELGRAYEFYRSQVDANA